MRFQQLHDEPDRTELNNADVENWGTAEVGTWLRQRGYGPYAHAFLTHKINGHFLLRLDDDQLADIIPGQPVGDRLTLLADAQRIPGMDQARKRYKVLWEDSSPDFVHGPCDWMYKWIMCIPCFAEGDFYKLTTNALIITEERNGSCCCNTCGYHRFTRNIDLSHVAGFNAQVDSQACMCGCESDYILVDTKQTVGLKPIDPIKVAAAAARGAATLPCSSLSPPPLRVAQVKKGTVQEVMTIMAHAMEEVQERDAGVKPVSSGLATRGATPAAMSR